jgi:2-polyprenyl-3-methyl-5-hydroxy-6-metoxy-1,4-benzoquinol methylase
MTTSTKSVRNAYNQWANVDDSDSNSTRDLNVKILRQQNFHLADKSVLEIGCGTGLNTV